MREMTPKIRASIEEKMRTVLATEPIKPSDVSGFVREFGLKPKLEDWDRSKLRCGLTREEREVMDDGWLESIKRTDPLLYAFLKWVPCDEFETLTNEEIIALYPEEAKERGLLSPAHGLKVGMFGNLKMKRGEPRMICITCITKQGKVKAEKFNGDTGEWGAENYIDPNDLMETWEEDDE